MRRLTCLLSSLLVLSCGKKKESSFLNTTQASMLHALPDFHIEHRSTKALRVQPQDCRAHIEEAVCLVEPADPTRIENNDTRPCINGSKDYAIHFQKLYDVYPPALQKMFCSLDRIYIEKKFFGTAYGGVILDDSEKIIGAKIGIRQSVIDEGLNLTTWSSWKDQLNFGGVTNSYTVTDGLPKHASANNVDVNDFLYFVIAHEFGHVFDFANGLNKIDPSCSGDECPFAKSSWGDLSWENANLAKGNDEFPLRKRLCFYTCDLNTIDKTDVPQLYRDLQRSKFISTYAATQAWDDFADSLAYVMIDNRLKATYKIDTQQNAVYDIIAKPHSPNFAQKRAYIAAFLNQDIKYP